MKKILAQKQIVLLLVGLLISSLANSVIQFSLSMYVLDLMHSPRLFANILACSILAKIIFTPVSGGVVDKYSKKVLMVLLDAAYLVCTILLIIGLKSGMKLEAVISYVVLVGALSALESPTVQATAPLICSDDDLMSVNASISQISVISTIIGPILAGLIYQRANVLILLFFGVVCFTLAVMIELNLRIPKIKSRTDSIVKNVKAGMRYLRTRGMDVVKMAILAGLINLIATSFIEVFLPVIFRIRLGFNSQQYGLIQGSLAISVVLGAGLTSIINKKIKPRNIYLIMMISVLPMMICGLLMIVLGKFDYLAGILIVIFFVLQGLFTSISVLLISKIQMRVPKDLLGSVMSIVVLGSIIAIPLGESLYGNLLDVLVSFNLIGLLLTVVAGLIAFIAYKFRKTLEI